MRQLTLLQRQKITLSLFFTVAVGAVATVATPAFVPWDVVDDKRAQALEQQRLQGRDFHVMPSRRTATSMTTASATAEAAASTSTSSSSDRPSLVLTPSPQGAVMYAKGTVNADGTITTDQGIRMMRRKKKKLVNEGWQELTGRTAREEQMRNEVLLSTSEPAPSLEDQEAFAAASAAAALVHAKSLVSEQASTSHSELSQSAASASLGRIASVSGGSSPSSSRGELGVNGGQEIQWANKHKHKQLAMAV